MFIVLTGDIIKESDNSFNINIKYSQRTGCRGKGNTQPCPARPAGYGFRLPYPFKLNAHLISQLTNRIGI